MADFDDRSSLWWNKSHTQIPLDFEHWRPTNITFNTYVHQRFKPTLMTEIISQKSFEFSSTQKEKVAVISLLIALLWLERFLWRVLSSEYTYSKKDAQKMCVHVQKIYQNMLYDRLIRAFHSSYTHTHKYYPNPDARTQLTLYKMFDRGTRFFCAFDWPSSFNLFFVPSSTSIFVRGEEDPFGKDVDK